MGEKKTRLIGISQDVGYSVVKENKMKEKINEIIESLRNNPSLLPTYTSLIIILITIKEFTIYTCKKIKRMLPIRITVRVEIKKKSN